MKQEGDGNVQVGINSGEIHIHQNLQSEAIERLEAKVDLILDVIINSKNIELLKYIRENLSQFDTIELDSYNGESLVHVRIPRAEIFKKPVSPFIKKVITSKKVLLNYNGIDLHRDILSVGNVISQIKELDA